MFLSTAAEASSTIFGLQFELARDLVALLFCLDLNLDWLATYLPVLTEELGLAMAD